MQCDEIILHWTEFIEQIVDFFHIFSIESNALNFVGFENFDFLIYFIFCFDESEKMKQRACLLIQNDISS